MKLSTKITIAILVIAICLMLLITSKVEAQDVSIAQNGTITVQYDNTPTKQALDELFKKANISYSINDSIDISNSTVISGLKNVSFDTVLNSILNSANPKLQYRVENGVYEISQAIVKTQNVESEITITPIQDNATKQIVVIYTKYINGNLLSYVLVNINAIPTSQQPKNSDNISDDTTTYHIF